MTATGAEAFRAAKPDLFRETRALTPRKEDHLTAFLAAAINCDAGFRRAYEAVVLEGLPQPAQIERAFSQAAFERQRCRPDLVLQLVDGRLVACEHKIDAPETTQISPETGKMTKQLERYLKHYALALRSISPHGLYAASTPRRRAIPG